MNGQYMAIFDYFLHFITIQRSLIGFRRSMSEKKDLVQTIMKDWWFGTTNTPPDRSELLVFNWLRTSVRDSGENSIGPQLSPTPPTGDRRC